jgi:hypothetical protein
MNYRKEEQRRNKMSQVIDMCEDSDDGKWPSTASGPSLQLSRKRPRNEEESFNYAHLCNENGPENKTTTVSAAFVVDLEHADEMEVVSPYHRERRGVVRGERSAKNDAECLQIRKGVEATKVGSEGAQVADHRESHKSIASAATHPMNSDSEQTSRNDGSANKHSQKLSTSQPPSNAPGRQWRVSAWENRLSELAEYRKIHGHCNVPISYKENAKLANWVANQRSNYRLHQKGKTSPMTNFRIQELESLGFKWDSRGAAWEDRLSELADYCKIKGHCNVPKIYSENPKLGQWAGTQRKQYKLHLEGNKSFITLPRIQALESLDFEWTPSISRGIGTRKKPSLDEDERRAHKKSANSGQDDSQLEMAPFNEMFRATGYY